MNKTFDEKKTSAGEVTKTCILGGLRAEEIKTRLFLEESTIKLVGLSISISAHFHP